MSITSDCSDLIFRKPNFTVLWLILLFTVYSDEVTVSHVFFISELGSSLDLEVGDTDTKQDLIIVGECNEESPL